MFNLQHFGYVTIFDDDRTISETKERNDCGAAENLSDFRLNSALSKRRVRAECDLDPIQMKTL